jgi:predicted site-specific integrase-resolvase
MAAQPTSRTAEVPEPHYTLQEAAEELGVSVPVLQAAISAGELRCTHYYARQLVTHADLEMYRQQQKQTAET